MKRLILFLAVACGVFGQATAPTAAPPPYVRVQYFANDGTPCAGCALWTYAAGTASNLVTWTDQTAMTANTDPVILDGSGRAAIYITDLAYKFTLETPIPTGMTHGTPIWTVDNIVDTGLIALNASGGAISTANINYVPPFSGSVGINLGTYLLSQASDVRTFGAVGYTGNCHALPNDDQPYIQAALNYAYAHGPANVFLPTGYCWPIGSHLWVPPGVHFYGEGRNFGSEVSSTGSLLIANSNWATTNNSFPYSVMVWNTGDNFTSGTYIAANVSFGVEIDHMEINCNDQTGCSNLLGVGRQEKSTWHDLTLTGSVPFSGGYSYGVYEQGVDCNNSGSGANNPPGNGCLFVGSGSGNPFSGQQGPDYHLEIFPSYNVTSTNFIPFAEMGANSYKGLRDSTLNGNGYSLPYQLYFWGEATTMGPGIHTESTTANKGLYIGNIPAGSTCNGGTNDVFIGFDQAWTIPNCGAQQHLTFINMLGGGTNNQTGAPQTTITDPDYFYDQATQTSGAVGSINPSYRVSSLILEDPAEYIHTGWNGVNLYNGNSHSGMNYQVMLDTNSVFTRGHISSNLYWNHTNGSFDRGSNGTTGYNSVGFINGGVCISNSSGISTPVTVATWLGNCYFTQSNAGHLLLGGGWIDNTTGLTVGEGSQAIQTHGGIGGDVQMASSSSTTCPTSGAAASTCTFTVPFAYTGYVSPPRAVCSLTGTATGTPAIQVVSTTTSAATVVVQQTGAGGLASPSGTTGASCFVTP